MARQVEHHEAHFETESLNELAHAEMPQSRLEEFLSNLLVATPAIRPAINAFAPATARTVAQALQSGDFSIFAKYLCSLRLPANGDDRLDRYFAGVFNSIFTRPGAPEPLRRVPASPLFPVYFGIREELADETGLNGRALHEEASKAFARFAVMASQNQPIPPHAGIAREVVKKDFSALLSQFPFTRGLALSPRINEHNVECALGNASSADLVSLIAFFRNEITAERAKCTGGIAFGQVEQVLDFLSYVEAILARKIAAELMRRSHPETGLEVPNVTYSMLTHPLAENLRNGRDRMLCHLKGVLPPARP